MSKLRGFFIIGTVLVALGLVLGFPSLQGYFRGQQVPRVAASPFTAPAAPAAEPAAYVGGEPVRLQIPALNLDLPVVKGYFNASTGQWTLTTDKAHYAVMTPLANNRQGNTFLYGHNRPEVFRNLNRISLGDKAVVTTANGHRFTYTFAGALETIPSDDSLFHYQGQPILTVQTCSGLWYENRQLFTFNLERVE